MRFPLPALLCLLVIFSGCSTANKSHSTGWTNRIRSLWAGLGPDAIQLEIAVVQQPFPDDYLARGLWREIDEQVVPLEQRPALEVNGFRLGTVSGNVPSGLQRLLTTEKFVCVQGHTWELSGAANDTGDKMPACPQCKQRAVRRDSPVTARRRGVKAGEAFFYPLGPTDKPLKATLHQDGAPTNLEYEAAQAGLQLRLTPAENGEVLVRCEPRVQHGSFLRLPQPSEDKSGWTFTPGRPEREFPKLAWEVSLEPDEYLVIGAWADRPETLGQHCFMQPDAGVQTILVLRVARPQVDPKAEAVAKTTRPAGGGAPLPLALQSIMPKRPPQQLTRGQSEP